MTNFIIGFIIGFAIISALTSYPVRAWWHDMRADWNQDELNRRSIDGTSSDVWAAGVADWVRWHCDYADALRARSTLLRLWAGAKAAAADMRKAMRRAS